MHGFKSPNGAWGRDGGAKLATVDDSGGGSRLGFRATFRFGP